MDITTLLEMAADAFPDRTAFVSGNTRLTYRELLAQSRAAASAIVLANARYLALFDVNSLAAPIALYGAAYAKIPYVPLNYRLTDREVAALADRLEGAFFVVGPDAFGRIEGNRNIGNLLSRERFLRLPVAEDQTPEPDDDDPNRVAVQLFTSGTTGAPKAAILRHDNLMAYILGTVDFASADETEANLVTAPPYHIAAISAILSSTYSGRRGVVMEAFDPVEWLDMCQAERITTGFVVPTMLTRIMDQVVANPGRWNLSSLRSIRFGGGKMPLNVIGKALELLPHVDFTNAYGMTETSSTMCMLTPEDHRTAISSKDPIIRRRLASVGRPIDTIEIEIRDDAGQPLPPDAVGDVFARGGQVSGEYIEQGSLLDGDGWFSTCDRGFLDDAGYLFLDGRADDVIVRGGENISPGEIEDVLLTHSAVAEVAVVSVPDDEWGEAIAAVIVLREGEAATRSDLQAWVKARLRSTRVPSRIEFRLNLPYNELGKVLRRVIRDELREAAHS
jgi:acyl-CoA synthetase (AMP-forming)/AMP-acid ligase II